MVSSKCFQVESPSPLRFFAALMPPCAQTECERFTGTMEKRSTCPPASAILMTAASPASPPPTTMTFGAAGILLPSLLLIHRLRRRCRFRPELVGTLIGRLAWCGEEAANAEHPYAADGHEDQHADN